MVKIPIQLLEDYYMYTLNNVKDVYWEVAANFFIMNHLYNEEGHQPI